MWPEGFDHYLLVLVISSQILYNQSHQFRLVCTNSYAKALLDSLDKRLY